MRNLVRYHRAADLTSRPLGRFMGSRNNCATSKRAIAVSDRQADRRPDLSGSRVEHALCPLAAPVPARRERCPAALSFGPQASACPPGRHACRPCPAGLPNRLPLPFENSGWPQILELVIVQQCAGIAVGRRLRYSVSGVRVGEPLSSLRSSCSARCQNSSSRPSGRPACSQS